MAQNTFRKKAPNAQKGSTEKAADAQSRAKGMSWRLSTEALLGFFRDRRFQLTLGLLFLFSSLFLLVASLSFVFTGKADQSVVGSISFVPLRTSGAEAANWLGLLGAVCSHYLIYEWFGLSAVLFPVVVFVLGFKLVFRYALVPIWRFSYLCVFLALWLSTLMGYLLHISQYEETLGYLSGGIGYEFSVILSEMLGGGTVLLLVFLLAVFSIYFFNFKALSALLGSLLSPTNPEASSDVASEAAAPEVKKGAALADNTPKEAEQAQSEPAMEHPENDRFEASDEPSAAPEAAPAGPAESPNSNGWQPGDQPEFVVEQSKNSNPAFSTAAPPKAPAESNSAPQHDDIEFEVVQEPQGELEEENPTPEHRPEPEMPPFDPTLDLSSYEKPRPDLLQWGGQAEKISVSSEELHANKERIIDTLQHYKVEIESIKATIGPTITLYELVPAKGVRISAIKRLENDIALRLAATGIRIIAPIPGRGTIGIEVPNSKPQLVTMRSVVESEEFKNADHDLPIVLGKTVSGEVYMADLATMPHLLIAGATGQGKSVGLNVMLSSLLYKKHPAELKMVLVDPKMVELSLYEKLSRHFLAALPESDNPIITDTKEVVTTLNSICVEMDQRYKLVSSAKVRGLKEYNAAFTARKLNPEDGHRYLPFMVVVVDEFADLMLTAGKEVEAPIARLSAKARAVGIHLILATQRPSVNVITGIIKANFPARISYKVSSMTDSRTILDAKGADQLIGKGDLLMAWNSVVRRLQSPFVDTHEVTEICDYIGNQRGYSEMYQLPEFEGDENTSSNSADDEPRDTLFEEAARTVVRNQQGSTSLLQRKIKVGYNRAGRLIDQLEAAGIVGPFEGSKAREVLVQDEYALEQMLNNEDDGE